MSKQATIASLVRTAAKSEAEFIETITDVFTEAEVERIADFFDRLNIPRSTTADDGLHDPLPALQGEHVLHVWGFEEEVAISEGMQRFLDRHERKIKWHATHPSIEGIGNVLLLFRACMVVTNLRLVRLRKLMGNARELTPVEWSNARLLMNRAYISFRNFLSCVATLWMDALKSSFEVSELAEPIGRFYELVDQHIQALEKHKEDLEEKRRELTVQPEGFPPVKPPMYFHGDLLGKGPWKQYWLGINGRAHSFREALG